MPSPIPSYDEANSLAPSSFSAQPPTAPAATELPPAYAVVDEKATTYTIYGTFIHTPSGPAYQLSSLLDARTPRLRLRRLRAEEVTRLQAGATSVSFDSSSTLYEAHDPPYLVNEYYIQGKHPSCLPGMLQLRFGLKRWHVRHMAQKGATASEILTCGKRGPLSWALWKERKNEMEPSEWRDSEGYVLATEVLKVVDGGKMPTIELRGGLDQTCREMLLALWVSRLWAAFGAGTRKMYMD